QEVQIISGTFNAEYGQAQSGVVNIVTKDGGARYAGTFSGYVGDYVSGTSGGFQHVGRLSPTDLYEVQGSLSGPVPGMGERLTFFASGRFVRNDGYLYGRRIVRPVYTTDADGTLVDVDGRQVFVPALGDSAYVPMNWGEQGTAQLKLTARLWGSSKLSVNGLLQRDRGQNYDHLFRYNPDGLPTNYGDSWSLTGTYSHVFSGKSFIDVKAAYFSNASKSYVYENPLDPRYPSDDALRRLGGSFSFYRGGAVMNHFARETTTMLGRIDVASQVTRRHQIKTGVEVKQHELFLDSFEIKNNPETGFVPQIPAVGTPDHSTYTRRPVEAAAYVQDKMEFEYLVVNLGIRLDYFDAAGEVLEDFSRPRS